MKSKNTAGILALLLGGFGVHKFYLNQPFMGLIYLFFSWTFIPAFISFFEALGLFFGSEQAFNSEYNRHVITNDSYTEFEAEPSKTCPFCAEQIKMKAVYCKHCKKDVPTYGF